MATECEAVARSTVDDGEAGGEAAGDDPLLVLSKFQEVDTDCLVKESTIIFIHKSFVYGYFLQCLKFEAKTMIWKSNKLTSMSKKS